MDNEIDKIRKKYKITREKFIDEKYESVRLSISFVKDFDTILNYIDKLQDDKNKLINYIAVREDKTFEDICKEFNV